MNSYILISANPVYKKSHKGGVLTLSIGLLEYAQKNELNIEVINTLRNDINDLSFLASFTKAVKRCLILIKKILFSRNLKGVIIVSSAGFSLYERSFQALITRFFNIKSILIIVDGNLLKNSNNKKVKQFLHKFIFRIPTHVASPGGNFNKYFSNLNLDTKRYFKLNFWLPNSFPVKSNPLKHNPNKPIKFLFVGWLIKEKGIIELLDSILLLKGETQFQIEIIGGGPLKNYISEFIHHNNLNSIIKFSGKVDDLTLRSVFANSHVFILPSYYEGFPMSIIEAFHYGLPVICSNVGGITAVVKNSVNGLIIDSIESLAIYKAVKFYLDNPSMIEYHSFEALRTAKNEFNQELNCDFLFSKFY